MIGVLFVFLGLFMYMFMSVVFSCLSDEYSQDEEKENHPTLSKRRRLGPPEPCKVEIRETGALLHLSLKEQQVHSHKLCTHLTPINN